MLSLVLLPDPVDVASRYEAKTRELARQVVDRFPQLHRVELRWHGWFVSADRWTPVSQRSLLRQLDVWLYAEARHRLSFSRYVDRSTPLQDSPKLILSTATRSHEISRSTILHHPSFYSDSSGATLRVVRARNGALPIDFREGGLYPQPSTARLKRDGHRSHD